METTTIIILAVMVLMLIGIACTIVFLVRSVKAKRDYETAELPDPFDAEDDEEVLPDIEESGFANLNRDFDLDDDESAEMKANAYRNDDD